jgi:hypothetical protein
MLFASLRTLLGRAFRPRSRGRRTARSAPPHFRPRVRALEDRTVPSSLHVV